MATHQTELSQRSLPGLMGAFTAAATAGCGCASVASAAPTESFFRRFGVAIAAWAAARGGP